MSAQRLVNLLRIPISIIISQLYSQCKTELQELKCYNYENKKKWLLEACTLKTKSSIKSFLDNLFEKDFGLTNKILQELLEQTIKDEAKKINKTVEQKIDFNEFLNSVIEKLLKYLKYDVQFEMNNWVSFWIPHYINFEISIYVTKYGISTNKVILQGGRDTNKTEFTLASVKEEVVDVLNKKAKERYSTKYTDQRYSKKYVDSEKSLHNTAINNNISRKATESELNKSMNISNLESVKQSNVDSIKSVNNSNVNNYHKSERNSVHKTEENRKIASYGDKSQYELSQRRSVSITPQTQTLNFN